MTTTSTNYFNFFKGYSYPLLPGDLIANNTIQLGNISLCDPAQVFSGNFRLDDQDSQSLQVNELSIDDIHFAHGVNPGENCALGEDVIVRHKCGGLICLDWRVFYAFRVNQGLALRMLRLHHIDRMYFDGSRFINAYGKRFVPALFYTGKTMSTVLSPLDCTRSIYDRSAVLTQ